jgi:hypothetical protein
LNVEKEVKAKRDLGYGNRLIHSLLGSSENFSVKGSQTKTRNSGISAQKIKHA